MVNEGLRDGIKIRSSVYICRLLFLRSFLQPLHDRLYPKQSDALFLLKGDKMLVQQCLAGAALLLASTSALPQPVRRETNHVENNSTTINGTIYTLTEVGARNTLVSPFDSSKPASMLKRVYLGLANVARTGWKPCFLLARHPNLPRRVEPLHHQLRCRDPTLDFRENRNQPRRALE